MKHLVFFLLAAAALPLAAQNGVGISVVGSTSACPNAIYPYQITVVGTTICRIDVTSTGGHRAVPCSTSHGSSHPSSDAGTYQSFTAYPQGTVFTPCIHWVSSGSKSLCFTAYNCNGTVASSFCLTINNISPAMVVQGNTYVCNGQAGYFTATSGLSNYIWTVVPDVNEMYAPSAGGAVVNIYNLQNSSWHLVSVQANDCWGTTLYGSKSFWTTQCVRGPEPEESTARSEEDATTPLVVYPNPVVRGEELMIGTDDAAIQLKEARLYAPDGRLVLSNPMDAPSGTLTMPDVAGLYLLTVLDVDDQLHRFKVVVTE